MCVSTCFDIPQWDWNQSLKWAATIKSAYRHFEMGCFGIVMSCAKSCVGLVWRIKD